MSKKKGYVSVPHNKKLTYISIVEIRAEEMRVSQEVTPPDPDTEIGVPIVFDFIFDASGSMSEHYGELANCFNQIMIPSLHAASRRYNNPFRVGCLLFSDKLVPAWKGFKSLGELGEAPLNAEMFRQSGLGGQTALFRAMESGVVYTAAAIRQFSSGAWGKVIVLTDGANNLEPADPMKVKDFLTQNRDNKKTFQTSIAYFKTGLGLSREQFDEMAKATAFEGLGFYEIAKEDSEASKGDTKDTVIEQQRRNFRHHFRVFSSRSLGQMPKG